MVDNAGMPPAPSPTPGKWPLRRALRARRHEIVAGHSGADRQRHAEAITAAVLDALARAGVAPSEKVTVAAYESMGHEPPTELLVATLRQRGHRVLVPITRDDLDLDWCEPGGEALGLDAIGEAALVVAPGLSVDRAGTRLGQGGGCYDRALTRVRPGTPVVTLLHDGELRDELLPRDAHDRPVDAVITPWDGLVELGPRPSGAGPERVSPPPA